MTLASLANLLIAHKKLDEAKRLLKRIIDAPEDPDWIPEDRELVAQAIATLKKLGGPGSGPEWRQPGLTP